MRRLATSLLLVALLLATAWWVGARPPGTTFIGAPYTSNEGLNTSLKTIDDVMCGGLPPLAPCQLPPTATLTVTGLLTAGQLSVSALTLTGPLTVQSLHSTGPIQADGAITGASLATTGAISSGATITAAGQIASTSGGLATAGPITSSGGAVSGTNLTATDPLGLTTTPLLTIGLRILASQGFTFFRIAGPCTTAASAGASCDSAGTWQAALQTTHATPLCGCEGGITGLPLLIVKSLTTTGATITTVAGSAAAANCGQIDCVAIAY